MLQTLLFVHNNSLEGMHGGSLVTRKGYDALLSMYYVMNYYVGKHFNKGVYSKLWTLVCNLFLYSGGLSLFDSIKIIKLLRKNIHISIIFFDVSLHGRLAKKIRKLFPYIKIIINFHNNEGVYFHDRVKTSGLLYLPLWLSAMYNEKLSIINSHLNIFITKEDRASIKAYDVPSIIIPVTLVDKFDSCKCTNVNRIINGKYILFVGIAGYANLHGIDFLIKNISPYITRNIVIVGKGMESALANKMLPSNIIVKDFVEDLSELYYSASAFIAPLFVGSGMKVKIAEAMMYGKKIIATKFALYGYEIDNRSCVICNNADDFIYEIANIDLEKTFYDESRKLFLDHYSASYNTFYYSQIAEILK
jgi:glycosyltransferase involved in cell wall biosynthesis